MNYELIKPIKEHFSAIEQILTNRNIPLEEIKNYLNTTDSTIYEPELFGEDNLLNALRTLIKCVSSNKKAIVIVDSDCDGFTSSAVLINYLYDLFPAWVENNLTWFLHEGKEHGLADFPFDKIKDIDLFLIPDASSNDYEIHSYLKEYEKDIIILDHHEADKISKDAIVINNQLCDYPNKFLSGVGVVWQFCRYIDKKLNYNYADKYIDLVALGLCGDMMSMVSLETKHLIQKGLKQIHNPFFVTMVEKSAYKMANPTPMGIAFYVVPYINAVVRSGTMEEKDIVFQSMLSHKAFQKILSNKRGHKPGELEQVYVQATRTVVNVKNRQTRAQDAGMEKLESMIEKQNLLKNKVLLFLLEPGDIDKNIAGLIANKITAKYQRPCCILTKVVENDKISYIGSARGCDKAGVINFKDICEETGYINFAQGHQGAFGLSIPVENESESEVQGDSIYGFIDRTNEILKDIKDEAVYYVDYIYDGHNVIPEHILEIANFEDLWGKDMDEPFVALKSLKVTKDMLTLMSPDKKPTLKITLPNKVSLIKFNSSQEEYESLLSQQGYIEINVVGTCNKNVWGNNVYPQILITDYEIIDRVKYIF